MYLSSGTFTLEDLFKIHKIFRLIYMNSDRYFESHHGSLQ